ncbi:hypothetical protein [Flavobacterium sp.]|uniref:hypothetical protein n=1 Tax=Flavobacterium sp. TaxID=239 RepID=UPI003750F5FE
MFETLKIKLLGIQPVPKITYRTLDRIIDRDFGDSSQEVKVKLRQVISATESGKNRISAAILKLSNRNPEILDNYIEISKIDFRDVISQAEYPRCLKLGFGNLISSEIKKNYLEDWKDYSKWLNE